MAVSVSTFKARWPEFASTSDDLVQLVLDEAHLECSAAAYKDQRNRAILECAADLLARHPFGEPARLSKDQNKTVYGEMFARTRRVAAIGLRYGKA